MVVIAPEVSACSPALAGNQFIAAQASNTRPQGIQANATCSIHTSGSLNVRGAWLHVASDTLASVGVILSGVGIWAFGWVWLDPAVSIVVSILVLFSAWHLIREALDVLMETVPAHLDPEAIRDALLAVPGVSTLHCLHVWTIGSGEVSLSSHLVVDPSHEPERLLKRVRGQLTDLFEIEHTTIQIEIGDGGNAACGDLCEPGTAAG